MSLPIKLGVGVLTLGSICGVTYAGIAYSQQGTEISKLIEKEFQYKLLDTTAGNTNPAQNKWKTIWQEYKKSSNNAFKLNGWKTEDEKLDLTETLKEKCKELSTTKVSDSKDNTYVNVTKYCARGVTFEEQAKKDNLEILDTSGSNHETIWTSIHSKHETMTSHLDNLNIKNPNNGDAIKTGCNTAKTKEKQVENYENIYASYLKVCIKQKGDQ